MTIISPQTVAKRLFVALDVPDAREAFSLAKQLSPLGVSFKVGMQLFYAEGIDLIRELQAEDHTVFVDLKLHDIPNTVAGAVDSLVRQGVNFFNVHTQGGPDMMRAAATQAKHSADRAAHSRPIILGVTLLTSLSETILRDHLGVSSSYTLQSYVQHLAKQAQNCGLDGVVCSAQEAPLIRESCGPDFLLVTPGIRPTNSANQDQARPITPKAAIQNGADYLVIGRPITGASSPFDATRRLLDEMIEAADK